MQRTTGISRLFHRNGVGGRLGASVASRALPTRGTWRSAGLGACFPSLVRGLVTLSDSSVGIVRVSGEDAPTFLQGLTTNDCLAGLPAPGKAIYTAFLNASGRAVWDSHIYKEKGEGEEAKDSSYLISIPLCAFDSALRALKMYKLRSKVKLEDCRQSLRSLVTVPESLGEFMELWPQGEAVPEPPSIAGAVAEFADTRSTQLGYRHILPTEEETDEWWDSEKRRKWYSVIRMLVGAPTGEEVIGTIPLEWNLEQLRGISFDKGCYVGQELMARTHFRGILRKRAVPCLFVDPDDPPEGLNREDVLTSSSLLWWVSHHNNQAAWERMSLKALRPLPGVADWEEEVEPKSDVQLAATEDEASGGGEGEGVNDGDGPTADGTTPRRRRRRARQPGTVLATAEGHNLGLLVLRLDHIAPAMPHLINSGHMEPPSLADDGQLHQPYRVPDGGSSNEAVIKPLEVVSSNGTRLRAIPLLCSSWLEIGRVMRWGKGAEA